MTQARDRRTERWGITRKRPPEGGPLIAYKQATSMRGAPGILWILMTPEYLFFGDLMRNTQEASQCSVAPLYWHSVVL